MMMREDREDERRKYCPTTYIDHEDSNGIVTPGTWRDALPCPNLCNFGRLGSNNATTMAISQRTTLAKWMLNEGQVPWQFQIVSSLNY